MPTLTPTTFALFVILPGIIGAIVGGMLLRRRPIPGVLIGAVVGCVAGYALLVGLVRAPEPEPAYHPPTD